MAAGVTKVSGLRITAPVRRELTPDGGPLRFGRDRANDIVLDPTDISISRLAGCIEFDSGTWQVVNHSTSRPLYTVDGTGIRLVLGVGKARLIVSDDFGIIVVGSKFTHTIRVELTEADRLIEQGTPTADDDRTLVPSLSHNELLAVVALCEGFLVESPRYHPIARSYEDAAARLGIARTTLRKRIERVRLKLLDAGVVELEVGDARQALCEFVLATSVVTKAHLALLPG